MEIMETVGFTNNLQDFCYQIHGNYWFQGRKHSKNLGHWGEGVPHRHVQKIILLRHLYIYKTIHVYRDSDRSLILPQHPDFASPARARPPARLPRGGGFGTQPPETGRLQTKVLHMHICMYVDVCMYFLTHRIIYMQDSKVNHPMYL